MSIPSPRQIFPHSAIVLDLLTNTPKCGNKYAYLSVMENANLVFTLFYYSTFKSFHIYNLRSYIASIYIFIVRKNKKMWRRIAMVLRGLIYKYLLSLTSY